MNERYAILIDAGYLYGRLDSCYPEQTFSRSSVKVRHQELQAMLEEKCRAKVKNRELLRIYWYDAAAGKPNAQQQALGLADDIKLRLGTFNAQGEQKGVDGMIISDMLALANHRAVSDMVLLCGDADMLSSVAEVQKMGVKIHLLSIGDSLFSVSKELCMEADSVREISMDELKTCVSIDAELAKTCEAEMAILAQCAKEVTSNASWEQMEIAIKSYTQDPNAGERIKSPLDSKLLGMIGLQIKRKIDLVEKNIARTLLVEHCKELLKGGHIKAPESKE